MFRTGRNSKVGPPRWAVISGFGRDQKWECSTIIPLLSAKRSVIFTKYRRVVESFEQCPDAEQPQR